jgi:hypothetical protein
MFVGVAAPSLEHRTGMVQRQHGMKIDINLNELKAALTMWVTIVVCQILLEKGKATEMC